MKKIVWAHKAKSFKDARESNARFWRRAGAEARFAAMWDCVKEYCRIKGIDANKLRMQKSVEKFKQLSLRSRTKK